MIAINLDEIVRKPNLISLIENLQDINDKILIYDLPEGSRLWPLDQSESFTYSLFFSVHEQLKNHKHEIRYLCSDLNIKKRYLDWCKLTASKPKFEVLCFPFTVRLDGIDFISSNKKSYDFDKIYTFCQLVGSPLLTRVATLNRFYKNPNYVYSYLNPSISHGLPIECKDFDKVKLFDIESVKLKELDIVDDWLKTDEGKNFSKLNEKQEQYILNAFNPEVSFKSCCDVIIETYINGPNYFTEKTWKQFLFEKPFLMIGNKNNNDFLKQLGFELYNEIFDYEFDKIDNCYERLKMFWIQIERYINENPKIFWNKLQIINQKLSRNKKLYIDYIKNISNFIPFEYHHLIFLNGQFYHRQKISDDVFNSIKKLCVSF